MGVNKFGTERATHLQQIHDCRYLVYYHQKVIKINDAHIVKKAGPWGGPANLLTLGVGANFSSTGRIVEYESTGLSTTLLHYQSC